MCKDKNLNRDKLLGTMKDYCKIKSEKFDVSDFEKMDATKRRVHITIDENRFYIDFWFKDNGTTTISSKGGRPEFLEMKEEIAKFIMESPECVIGGEGDVSSKRIIVENIEYNDFCTVIEIIKDSEYFKEETSATKDSIKENHNMRGSMNEKLSLFYYFSNKKVMVQGRPLLLFYETLACISELVDIEELPKVFKDYYTVGIVKSDIESVFQTYFPSSFDKFSPKEKKVLCQCVYNLGLDGDMFDYTFLVFPVLRALEGQLKKGLSNVGIQYNRINGFDMFRKQEKGKTYVYVLHEDFHEKVKSPCKIDYFGRAYTFFKSKRHELFHWGDENLLGDQTPIIESLSIAKDLIKDTINIIDEYYRL